MKKLFISFILMLVSGAAFSAEYRYAAPLCSSKLSVSEAGTCSIQAQGNSGCTLGAITRTSDTSWTTRMVCGTQNLAGPGVSRSGDSCPSGQTLRNDGQTCEVPPPPVDPCADKNPFVAPYFAGADGSISSPTSSGECEVTVIRMLVCHKNFEGKKYCLFEMVRTGKKVTAPPATTPPTTSSSDPRIDTSPDVNPPPGSGCPKGTVQIGTRANGDPICAGSGDTPNQPKAENPKSEVTQTVTNADNSKTTTKTTTITNKDLSTTVIKDVTTTLVSGQINTSQTATTSNTPSGQPGVTDGSLEDQKSDFCKQNPLLQVCQNSSVSGTCGEISCRGDAIQCATLRETAKMQCRQQQDADEAKAHANTALGTAAAAGNDPLKSSFPTVANASKVTVPGTLDGAGWMGGGSCFADKTFTIRGHSIVLPLSKGCDILLALRFVMMIMASLVSFRTISSAVFT